MPNALTINGVTYQYPVLGDENWGPDASNWASAVTSGTLQKAGGTFILTNELDFGALFGLKTLLVKFKDGTVSAPSVTFQSEINSGIYRPSGGSIGFSILGSEVFQIQASAIQAIVPFGVPDGSASAPGLALINDLGTGLYRFASHALGFATNGVSAGRIDSSQVWQIPQGLSANGLAIGLTASVLGNVAQITNGSTIIFKTNGSTTAITLGVDQKATFAGDIAVTGVSTLTGVTDGSLAAAGKIGERITSFATATNAATSGQYGDLTSISVTAGDWEIRISGEAVANATAVVTQNQVGISTTTGNSSTGLVSGDSIIDVIPQTANYNSGFCLSINASFNSTTIYYFKMLSNYTVTIPKFRGRITATRLR